MNDGPSCSLFSRSCSVKPPFIHNYSSDEGNTACSKGVCRECLKARAQIRWGVPVVPGHPASAWWVPQCDCPVAGRSTLSPCVYSVRPYRLRPEPAEALKTREGSAFQFVGFGNERAIRETEYLQA